MAKSPARVNQAKTDDGKPKCGAKCRDGHRCINAAMENGRCRRHGGLTPSGVACANFKHGAYSKHLPERMAGTNAQAHRNTELLSSRDDLALLFARLCDVLDRVDTGESGEMWRSLLGSIKEVQRCRRAFDKAMHLESFDDLHQAGKELNEVLDSMELLAQGGVSDYAAWREVRSIQEQMRKTRESEWGRLVKMQEMMTQDTSQMMMGKVLVILRSWIHDPETLRGISADLRRVVAVAAGG